MKFANVTRSKIEALKKMVWGSEAVESNAADMAELRNAFLKFKTCMNAKVDALEHGTIIAVEKLVVSDDNTDSVEDY